KTGSAEHGKNMDTHSWFIAYAPANNPRVAIAVVVEAAGHGGDIAAPIARDVIAKVLSWAKAG
ncbi:MAG: penicillin-binding transpeptidase domain-containing protein, partial [Candidatus Nitrosotenuis sp.]